MPGLAAEEMEQQITIPLDLGLNGTPRLTSMRSVSTFGSPRSISSAQDYSERHRVRDRVGDVSLSAGASLSPVAGQRLGVSELVKKHTKCRQSSGAWLAWPPPPDALA
jgi:Cu/Ag efflux pump CusA